MNIKDFVSNGNTVKFDSYRQGHFYYKVRKTVGVGAWTGYYYQFPVPLEDIGTATLLAEDKALTYMRWIRKAIDDKTLIEIK